MIRQVRSELGYTRLRWILAVSQTHAACGCYLVHQKTTLPPGPTSIKKGSIVKHRCSTKDRDFRTRFEDCIFPPADFSHRAHIRLAYVYLTEHDTDTAHQLMQRALLAFLQHYGVDVSKYHETMTRAWIMAVRHFMDSSPATDSSEAFIENNPRMLDSKIMLSHYSAELLFSDEARAKFVEPNLSPIPTYDC